MRISFTATSVVRKIVSAFALIWNFEFCEGIRFIYLILLLNMAKVVATRCCWKIATHVLKEQCIMIVQFVLRLGTLLLKLDLSRKCLCTFNYHNTFCSFAVPFWIKKWCDSLALWAYYPQELLEGDEGTLSVSLTTFTFVLFSSRTFFNSTEQLTYSNTVTDMLVLCVQSQFVICPKCGKNSIWRLLRPPCQNLIRIRW